MQYNDETISSPQAIVNAFACHFSAFFSNSSNTEQTSLFNSLDASLISVDSVTLEEVTIAIKSLKGNLTAGHDQVPAFLLKDCSFYLAPAIQKLINSILANSTFPSRWKISKITPVFKNGSKTNVSNYRPVALLSNLSKVFEAIIHKRLFASFSTVISEFQHGFFSGGSTSTNLIQMCQFISSALDLKQQVDVIYTDLSKAFDSIHHEQLLCKLRSLGCHNSLTDLIRSYLEDRSYYVSYNGFVSVSHNCSSGVPQGSILGPLLVSLYINHLLISIPCQILAYADDIKIFSVVKDYSDCTKLQTCLEHINLWCLRNNLMLNSDKCKVVRYTRRLNEIEFNYSIDNTILETATTIKDLGIIFDKSLTFKQHYQYLSSSSLKLWGFVVRICKEFKNMECIKTLYYSLVRSKLEYGAVVWNPFYKGDIFLIEKTQRRYLKYIFLKIHKEYPPQNLNYSLLLTCTNDDSLHYRRLLCSIKFVYKLLHNTISCNPLFLLLNFSDRRLSSRKPLIFTNKRPNTNILMKSPIYTACEIINAICNVCDIYNDDFKIVANHFNRYYHTNLNVFM